VDRASLLRRIGARLQPRNQPLPDLLSGVEVARRAEQLVERGLRQQRVSSASVSDWSVSAAIVRAYRTCIAK
jgi:hypothetical protein